MPNAHPLFAGRAGTIGDRAGNFAVQNADGGWGDVRHPSEATDAAWRMLATHGDSVLGLWSKGYYTSPGGLWGARLVSGGEWEAPQLIVESGSVIDPIDLRMSSPSDAVCLTGAPPLEKVRSCEVRFTDW